MSKSVLTGVAAAVLLVLAVPMTASKIYVETGLMLLDHEVYERPYPRRGCRRCKPESVDIPFYASNGQELYLNVGKGFPFGNRLSVITCDRKPAGYDNLETLVVLRTIMRDGGLPDDQWSNFCNSGA